MDGDREVGRLAVNALARGRVRVLGTNKAFVALGRTGFGAAPGIADTQDAEERQDAGDEDAGDTQDAPPRP